MREVFLPRNLADLWEILDKNPDCAIYSGGTDLLLKIRGGLIDPPCLVCLERIEEIRGVHDEGNTILIGAATTLGSLMTHPAVLGHFPVLAKALSVLASPTVRHMGTVGGNIVNASPAGDTLPPLYVLGAELEIRSIAAFRRLPLREFIIGPGETMLQKGEILTAIRVAKAPRYNLHHYEKVGRRKAQACAVVSMAALLQTSDDGLIREARLAWGSVGPKVVTLPDVEQALIGKSLSTDTLKAVMPAVEQGVSPIHDVRASSRYRRVVAGQLLLRLSRYGI